MADDSVEALNALEILFAECRRLLQTDNWREQFSLRLLEKVESLANRARINSPFRFHKSPFDSQIVVSFWCPWTIECTFVGTHAQFFYEPITTTLEKWINWRHFHNAGGEPDLVIRNQNLWPPSRAGWDKRTEIRESECQSLLASRDSRGLSNLFSVSPRAFVFALGSWLKSLDELFEICNGFTSYREPRGHVTHTHLADLKDVLGLITEAHANVEHKSEVVKFDCSTLTWFDKELGKMLTYQERSSCLIDSHNLSKDSSIHRECQYFERTLMQSWLTELAHSTDLTPPGQFPTPEKVFASESVADAHKHGKVPYWDNANSTLWLNGKQRRYANQLGDSSREIFMSLQNVNWTTVAPCSTTAAKAKQCCKDRSDDNKLGIEFTYQAGLKAVKATWKMTTSQSSPNLPETHEKSPETPGKSLETP